jgi:hypothetical protein
MCSKAVKKNLLRFDQADMGSTALKKNYSDCIVHIGIIRLSKKNRSDSIRHICVLRLSKKFHSDLIMHICLLRLSKKFIVIQSCIYVF